MRIGSGSMMNHLEEIQKAELESRVNELTHTVAQRAQRFGAEHMEINKFSPTIQVLPVDRSTGVP